MNYFDKVYKYNDKLKEIFNLLSIDGEYSVIGSATLKKIKYRNDYDLMELYKKKNKSAKNIKQYLYKVFLQKFDDAYSNKKIWITDFKCGMDYNGEPLRWNYKDMVNGYKIMSNKRKINFVDCILQKTMMKMDIVSIVDGLMTEFSENYYIKIGDDANFFKHDTEKDHLLNEIKKSYYEYYDVKQNYYKALKRVFSYKLLLDKNKYKKDLILLMDFFNSKTGYMNKIKSELETMILMKEQTFRPVKKEDFNKNIMVIMNQLNDVKLNFQLTDDLDSIEKLMKKLNDLIQKDTLDFINKNPNIII
jgi:hypothetical protein